MPEKKGRWGRGIDEESRKEQRRKSVTSKVK
jgi:hypothetical protein